MLWWSAADSRTNQYGGVGVSEEGRGFALKRGVARSLTTSLPVVFRDRNRCGSTSVRKASLRLRVVKIVLPPLPRALIRGGKGMEGGGGRIRAEERGVDERREARESERERERGECTRSVGLATSVVSVQ